MSSGVAGTTQMSKSYKMPVLMAFYNDGDIKTAISEDDIYRSYMGVFMVRQITGRI